MNCFRLSSKRFLRRLVLTTCGGFGRGSAGRRKSDGRDPRGYLADDSLEFLRVEQEASRAIPRCVDHALVGRIGKPSGWGWTDCQSVLPQRELSLGEFSNTRRVSIGLGSRAPRPWSYRLGGL